MLWHFFKYLSPIRQLLCLWLVALGLTASVVSARDVEVLRNCVDHCVVEFCTQCGNRVTLEDLDGKLIATGMNRSAPFRSLAECIELLEVLGTPVEAQYRSIDAHTLYPPNAIVYLPPSETWKTGHVITIVSSGGQFLSIYDPAREPSHYKFDASKVKMEGETIMLVPKDYVRAEFLRNVLAVFGGSIAIAALVACGYFIIQLRSVSRKQSHLCSPCILVTIALFATQFGCNSRSGESEIKIDRERFDFGVIDPDLSNELVSHTFIVQNNGGKSYVIDPASTSCSCVVPQFEASKMRIEPGMSRKIPVSIRLKGKVGPFEEEILFRFKADQIADRIIKLKGFVARKPFPAITPFTLRALAGQTRSQDLEVVYPRTNQHTPSKLASWIVRAESEQIAKQFVVKGAKEKSGIISSGYFADVWTIPIAFANRTSTPRVNAQLELSWDSPPGKTTIALVGEALPPVELTSKAIFFDCIVGDTCERSLPIRIYDHDRARLVKVGSEAPGIQGEIVEETSELKVSFRCDQSGDFKHRVYLSLDGSVLGEVEVFGHAKAGM